MARVEVTAYTTSHGQETVYLHFDEIVGGVASELETAIERISLILQDAHKED